MKKEKRFNCAYCDARYVHEKTFLKHECKQKIRHDEIKTVEGQLAWSSYKLWFKLSKNFVPSRDLFLISAQYASFMKFAHFAKRVQIADIPSYIKIMVKNNNIPPYMWILPDAHALYLTKLDRLMSPLQMVDISIDTLFDLADDYNVPVSDIFDVVAPTEIIVLLQRRKLSPWLLVKSPNFVHFFTHSTSTEERIILQTIIKFDFWSKKFLKHKTEVDHIKKIVAELKL